MEIGASFSHRHLKSLNLDPLSALSEFKKLGLKWIRLGCYWDEIEKEKGKFDFSQIKSLINYCDKNDIKVVLTVGMKAPRWPEYYFPGWIDKRPTRLGKISKNNTIISGGTKLFIDKTIKLFKENKSIKVWQVENEPLDYSGEKWWKIDFELLKEEIKIVRKIDPTRKILINLWGNELSKRKLYKKAIEVADIVGFDLYTKHQIPYLKWFSLYIGPFDSSPKIRKIIKEIKQSGKEFWIAELQAEPWEANGLIFKGNNPPSFRPEKFEKNLEWGKSFKPSVILLWGFEYWYWRKTLGDLRYWNEAKRLLK